MNQDTKAGEEKSQDRPDGAIPTPVSSAEDDLDRELQTASKALMQTTLPHYLHLERIEFNRTLGRIWGLVQLGNQYIVKTAPWVLAKDPGNQDRLHKVL